MDGNGDVPQFRPLELQKELVALLCSSSKRQHSNHSLQGHKDTPKNHQETRQKNWLKTTLFFPEIFRSLLEPWLPPWPHQSS